MNDRKLIAEALLEISQRSETTFIEVAKEDTELINTAKQFNIELPSPDLLVMKTVYAEIDKVNKNGVVLPREAVEKGLKTLVGKQCNWEHAGAGFICGYTIKATINKDKIETINVLFKSLFPEQAEELKEKVKSKEATVSFEIWNRNPETGESVVTQLEDGTRTINPILFHGTGVLLAHKPACPKAQIFKLVGKKLTEAAEKVMNRIFEEDLIFAELAIEEPKCKSCDTCNCEKEESMMIKCEKCGKEFEASAEEKICVECASLPKEEPKAQSSEETKTDGTPVETKPEDAGAETKAEETKVEETKEESQSVEEVKPTRKLIKIVTLDGTEVTEIFADGASTSDSKRKIVTIRYFDDGTDERSESYEEIVRTYSYAELEEKVNAAKVEKDTEITTLKTEHETVLKAKEDEITTLKAELLKKEEEISDLKNPKVVVAEQKTISVGDVTKQKSDLEKEAEKINEIIAEKHKQ